MTIHNSKYVSGGELGLTVYRLERMVGCQRLTIMVMATAVELATGRMVVACKLRRARASLRRMAEIAAKRIA